MKNLAHIILATFLASCVCLLLAGCLPDSREDEAWEEYNRQQQEEAKLKEEAWAQFQRDHDEEVRQKEKIWKTIDKQLEKDSEYQERYEKILIKWEEQSTRFDRVLDAMEKQYNIEDNQ